MHTSNYSIWIKGKNYDANKRCLTINDEKEVEENEKNNMAGSY